MKLKTRIRRHRCNEKTFAPRMFDGKIGASRKSAHDTHLMRQARGLIWCSKCGQVGSLKPKGLLVTCPERPSPFGKRSLERIAKGLPPHHLAQWPCSEQGPPRRLWTEGLAYPPDPPRQSQTQPHPTDGEAVPGEASGSAELVNARKAEFEASRKRRSASLSSHEAKGPEDYGPIDPAGDQRRVKTIHAEIAQRCQAPNGESANQASGLREPG